MLQPVPPPPPPDEMVDDDAGAGNISSPPANVVDLTAGEAPDAPAKEPPIDYATARQQARLHVAAMADEYGLPACPGKRKRGAPSHRDIWLRGIYQVLDDVAMGRTRRPPTELMVEDIPVVFKCRDGFNEAMVRRHFHCRPEGAAEDLLFVDEDVSGMRVPAEEPLQKGQRKFYTIEEKKMFLNIALIHQGKCFHQVCATAREQLPWIFLQRTKDTTFKRFEQDAMHRLRGEEGRSRSEGGSERCEEEGSS